ncbi:MAG: outer membrane protein assembly factor [Gammaproteobacteria bacterium]|nr:outer membrane protein assembly factor [Gammaproteobacteria bacterium]
MTRKDLRLIRCLFGLLILIFSITAYAATPSVDVQVQGVSGDLLKNVLAYLSINTYRSSPNLNASLVDRLNARAPREIKQALQPFGYYQTVIKSELLETPTGWSAKYEITPGTPVLIRTVDVQISGDGKDDPAFKKYLAVMPLKSGQQLNQPAYENLKQGLQAIAARQGYIDAKFASSVLRVDPAQHWADVVLHLETGPRYYFGAVIFVQDFMQESFLKKYLTFKPGDAYDNNKLLALEYALDDSEYFASVDLEVQRKQAGADRRIPIRIVLTPNKRNKYILGIGYGTDTGPRATLGWENRRLNGEGHRFSVLGQYSHVLTSTQVNYTVPDPNGAQVVYGLSNTRQVFPGTGVAYTNTLGVNRYTSLNAWAWNQYLQLEHDSSDLNTGNTTNIYLLPGSTFSRSYGNEPIFPTEGYRVSLDIRGADNALLSNTTFLQLHLISKLILPLGDSTRLLLRGEVGATALSKLSELPLSQRFFAGGDQSVRGYAYNTLGPVQNGNVVGGKDLLVGSIEVDQRLTRIFGVAAFIDAGNAMNSFNTSLDKGVGVGLRWRTPVGMIRFDVAHPLKDPTQGWYRIHISIGPDL